MNTEKETYDIFISYRRDGGEDLATLLKDRLGRLGYKVFLDVESLQSGDYPEALLDAIENSTDVLLVLPEKALDRCCDPKDWVRQEIIHALKHHKNIIPVMKRNFKFPEELPTEIDEVRNKNGVYAHMDIFDAVIDLIVTKRLHSKPSDSNEEALICDAESGDPKAQNELALCYEFGSTKIIPNNPKALLLYLEADANGYCPAAYNIGDIYEKCSRNFSLISDYGIEIDMRGKKEQDIANELMKLAVSFYKKAADADYAPAIYKLGNIEEQEKNPREAFGHYEKAAEKNYPPAQNAIGYYLQNGIAGEENRDSAIEYYKKAADAHYAPAIYNYAIMIRNTDPKKAMNLLRTVAYGEKALPFAVYALGKMYEDMQDFRNAAECYDHAVDAGLAKAEHDYNRCRGILDKKLLEGRT